MLDLSELLKTQYEEFVDLLQTWPAFDLLKAKFCHLEAIVERERIVKSVATVCDKRNAIANSFTKKKDECNLGLKGGQGSMDNECGHGDSETGNGCEQDDSESEPKSEPKHVGAKCGQDDAVDDRCEQDDRKPETNCNQYDNTYDNDCKQDDIRPVLNRATVDNEYKKDDFKPKKDCNQDDNECEQDAGKPELNCLGLEATECRQDDCALFGDFSNAILTWSPGGWYMKIP